MEPSRKELHELFVSHLNGTTPTEILILCLLLPISSCLVKILHLRNPGCSTGIEILILLSPLLLCITFWSDYVYQVFVILFIINSCLILKLWPSGFPPVTQTDNQFKYFVSRWKATLDIPMALSPRNLSFISEHRSALLLNTCLCILAVDFPVFPRRFAKTETYGWGFMDVGVGIFVVINALTSRETFNTFRESRFTNLRKAIVSSIPITVLGVVRVLTLKAADYHIHVSEYGIHWNFFFTLAVTKIMASVPSFCIQSPLLFSVAPWMLIVAHQILLLLCGTQLILGDAREGFFMANKEGILSLGGYLALYLLFVGYGREIRRERGSVREWLSLVVYLTVRGGLAWLLMLVVHHYVQGVSRRMANLGYFLHMISLNLFFLGSVLLVDVVIRILRIGKTKSRDRSGEEIVILEAVNYNALPFFLASNILTGVINVTFDTIHSSDAFAFLILASYVGTLCILSVILYRYKIKLKM